MGYAYPSICVVIEAAGYAYHAMSDSAFYKRFRSSYESSPSSSPPDLPLRKRYRGTSELVKDEEEEEEDEETEESSDSDSESEDAKDEGPIIEDKDPAAMEEGLAARDEGPGMRVKSLSLGGDEAVPEGQQRQDPVVETAVGEPLRLGFGVLRNQKIALGEGWMPSVFEIVKERRARLDLAEIVDSMRRGQEPRGDV
nr:hypothetical protein [Tanacetum cinerariifolium]